MNKIYRFGTQLAIGFILLVILFVSCVQYIDRRSFNNQVEEIAKNEAKKSPKDSSIIVIDTIKRDNRKVAIESDSIILISKTNVYSFSKKRDCSCNDSPLDILSKSNALLNASDLRFCVTLIVSLLMALLLYRIEKMEKLVEQNKKLVEQNKKLKNETLSYYTHTAKFDNILTRIESAYNMTILIENTAAMLLPEKSEDDNKIVSENVGYLRSRLSLICSDIDDRLKKRESRLDFISKEEKIILNMYLEDALGELQRCLSYANRIKSTYLFSIITGVTNDLQNVKDTIDAIELKESA